MDETPKTKGWLHQALRLAPTLSLLAAALAIIFAEGSGCGDSPEEFRGMGFAVSGALALTVLLAVLLDPARAERIRRTSDWLVCRFLAFIMMSYGWAKILDMQFMTSLASFDSRVLDLSPMQVAWAFFGYTYTYQAFAGLGEVVGALLLCFRRTRTLGACVLLAVLSNVVLINIFYDVCVKLNSSVYLAMTVYFLALDSRRLWLFFATEKTVPSARRDPWQPPARWRPWWLGIQVVVLLFVLIYPIYDVQTSRVKYGISEPGPFFGVWQIESITVDGEPSSAEALWQQPWERFFLEIGLWGSAKGADSKSSFSYEFDESAGTVELKFRDPELTLAGRYQLDGAGRWRFELEDERTVIEFSKVPEFNHERR